jgi:hypothetical protein
MFRVDSRKASEGVCYAQCTFAVLFFCPQATNVTVEMCNFVALYELKSAQNILAKDP